MQFFNQIVSIVFLSAFSAGASPVQSVDQAAAVDMGLRLYGTNGCSGDFEGVVIRGSTCLPVSNKRAISTVGSYVSLLILYFKCLPLLGAVESLLGVAPIAGAPVS